MRLSQVLRVYRIIRFRQGGKPRTIRNGLSLQEAQAWCSREDTHGVRGGKQWFDGYNLMRGVTAIEEIPANEQNDDASLTECGCPPRIHCDDPSGHPACTVCEDCDSQMPATCINKSANHSSISNVPTSRRISQHAASIAEKGGRA